MYLDPGVGSIILQVVIAAVLGVGVFVKLFWKKVKTIFSKNDGIDFESDQDEE